MDTEASSSSLASLQDRYILTQVGHQRLAFPSQWVAEILLIERWQILNLPFYAPMILGVVHHQGRIVPLLAIQHLFAGNPGTIRETVSVVQLSREAGNLAGIGIVVDRALENRSRDQLPDGLFHHEPFTTLPPAEKTTRLFSPEILDDRLWHPQRWQPS